MTKRYGKTGNPEQRAEMAQKAYAMRLKGATNEAIGQELGVSRETVRKLLTEYRTALTAPEADELRRVENDKLDRLEAVAWKLLEENHVAFQHGKVVSLDGKPISDKEPVFKAIDRLLKTSESRRKLWGVDVPVKTEHHVTTSSVVDESIAALVAEMEAQNQADRERTA